MRKNSRPRSSRLILCFRAILIFAAAVPLAGAPLFPPVQPDASAAPGATPRTFESAVGTTTADLPRVRRASDLGALSVAPASLALPKNLTAAARPPLRQPVPPPPSTIWMRMRRVLFGLKPVLEE